MSVTQTAIATKRDGTINSITPEQDLKLEQYYGSGFCNAQIVRQCRA